MPSPVQPKPDGSFRHMQVGQEAEKAQKKTQREDGQEKEVATSGKDEKTLGSAAIKSSGGGADIVQ